MQLKHRFLDAVVNGELGTVTEQGVTVTLRQFKTYFSDVNARYIVSFLPAAVIESGQHSITHTKFLYRIGRGLYLVHPDAIEEHKLTMWKPPGGCAEQATVYWV